MKNFRAVNERNRVEAAWHQKQPTPLAVWRWGDPFKNRKIPSMPTTYLAVVDRNTPVQVELLGPCTPVGPFGDFWLCRAKETVPPVVQEGDVITVHRQRLHEKKEGE